MPNWFANKSFSSLTSLNFNDKIAISWSEFINLYNDMIAPNVFQQFFSKIADWVTYIVAYPFAPVTLSTVGKIKVGGVTSSASGSSLVKTDMYYLGQYLCSPILNNFADYNGYSRIFVFLPFNGLVEVLPNDCLGKYITVTLSIDWENGNGTYYISVGDGALDIESGSPIARSLLSDFRIIGTYVSQIGFVVPFGSSNANDVMRNLALGTVKTAAGAALGGWSASAAPEAIGSMANIRIVGDTVGSLFDSLGSLRMSAQFDRPSAMQSLRAASLSVQIVRITPRLKNVEDSYNKLYGKPLMKNVFLETLTGYTKISDVHVEGGAFETATKMETDEIYDLLTSGVIF